MSKKQNVKIDFVWTPAHSAIKMNDLADKLAKSGAQASKDLNETHPVTVGEARQLNKSITMTKCRKRWQLSSPTTYKAHVPQLPGKLAPQLESNIKPSTQKKITRLRMNHSYLAAHTAVYTPTSSKECNSCGKTEDLYHVLFECVTYSQARQEMMTQCELALMHDPCITDCTLTAERILGLLPSPNSQTNLLVLEALAKYLEDAGINC
jgi:ribosomal protein L32